MEFRKLNLYLKLTNKKLIIIKMKIKLLHLQKVMQALKMEKKLAVDLKN